MPKSNKQHPINISSPVFQSNNNATKDPSVVSKIASYILTLRPQTPIPAPQEQESSIRIICISDTHTTQPSLPAGDILLHSGDLTTHGTFSELQAQLSWLNSQPHAHKLVIAGNHDSLLDAESVRTHPWHHLDEPGRAKADLDWGDVIYLESSSAELTVRERKVKVFGSPLVPRCGNFAFQYDPDTDVWKDRIPDGTDVVIVHGPAAGHLDGDKGCPFLLREVWRVEPQLVVFGHIHHARGQEVVVARPSQKVFEEIAAGVVSWVCLLRLWWAVLRERIWPPTDCKEMRFVNAACYGGEGSIVVSI